jgi:hypothetical protein
VTEVRGVLFTRNWVSDAGDFRYFRSAASAARAQSGYVILITRGSERLEKNGFSTVLSAGMTNLDCPDLVAGEVWKATALSADLEFYCVMRRGRLPLVTAPFTAARNESITIPPQHAALIGGGANDRGRAPLILTTSGAPADVLFSTAGFGLLVALP